MGRGASRAIEIVRKVVAVASRSTARERSVVLGERALVKVLHVSSAVARQLSRAPFPPTTATQRLTMEALASQLRSLAGGVLVSEASRDASTVEGAMAEAVEETLRLVEIALGTREPELAPVHSPIALGAGDGGGSES